jgi:hypothetical protein
VLETPTVEPAADFATEQVSAAKREPRAIDDQIVKFGGLSAVLTSGAVETRWEWRVPWITERAHQDRLMHCTHAIARAHTRFAGRSKLAPNDFRTTKRRNDRASCRFPPRTVEVNGACFIVKAQSGHSRSSNFGNDVGANGVRKPIGNCAKVH